MRKAGIFLTAALLVFAGGTARADDKPTGGGTPSSEPGVTEPTQPEPAYVLDVETVTLKVDGKVVDAAPPGVTVVVTVRLHNFSSDTAREVKAHLEPSQQARVSDADATYGDIDSGESADGNFALVVDRDPCPDFVGLGGEISHAGGTGPLKVGIATACPGPRLFVENVIFEGGDGDGVPEPGETLRAFVVLRNDGRDPAESVRASVKVSGKGVASSSDELTWPDIAPGKTAKSGSALTVKVADDAQRHEGCPGMARDDTTIAEVPPEDRGTISPDTPVSSDGSSGAPAGNVSSAPGSSGAGSAGSTGTEPSTVEPDPGTGTIQPEPVPAPGTPEPGPPEPEPEQDRPVLVQMQLDVSATGYTASLEYSNATACALAEGGGKGVPAMDARMSALGASGTKGSRGGAALPLGLALLVSAVAVSARRFLVR